MDAFSLVALWLTSLAAGALLAIGICTVATGRAVINFQHTNWSVGEARFLGTCSVIQGVAAAAYALFGGLTVGAHLIPLPGVGSPWGLFVTAPFAVTILVTLFAQGAVQLRHADARQPRAS